MNLKVNPKLVLTDDEYDLDLLVDELIELDYNHQLPRWAYLNSEWSAYMIKRVAIVRRLRKLQASIEYNNDVADLVL